MELSYSSNGASDDINMTLDREVSLIVPVHHCNGSLARTIDGCGKFLDAADGRCELILVDDHGSDPRASLLLSRFAQREEVRLLRNDRNRGKGYSVKQGMVAACGRFRVFTDADLAYPLEEVWRIVAALDRGADVAVACRVLPQSRYEMTANYLRYFYTRHAMSRAFNRLVRLTLLPGVLDTQAGLKGYTATAAREVFSRVSIPGFGFDLECLFVARSLGLRVEQLPVRFRYDDEPSTVRFIRDAVTMTSDLARIRFRGWTGEYAQAAGQESRALSPQST
jgi:dolichyl-phosphate beta-glucosyltransferase